jgi:hypothetical protein
MIILRLISCLGKDIYWMYILNSSSWLNTGPRAGLYPVSSVYFKQLYVAQCRLLAMLGHDVDLTHIKYLRA